jgi:hypothetical protein
LTLFDVLFALAFLFLLVWLVRLDWQREQPEPVPVVHGATHSSCTSV